MKTRNGACGVLLAISLAGPSVLGQEVAISIKGSNTFGEELGPRLIEDFRERNPGIQVSLGTEGSGSGMNALLNGECDIASTSRVASEDELRRARALGLRLRTHFLGSYGVAVIVNQRAGIHDLSHAQILDLFTGRIANWKEVGGADLPVRLHIRDPISGTYLGFQELAMENRPYAAGTVPHTTYHDLADAVARDHGGVGYTGMTLKLPDGVRSVRVNGVPPNLVSVNEGLYPYARGLRFYTVRGRESSAANAFIRYVRDTPGQALLQREGFVPRTMLRIDPGSPVH